MKWGAARCVVVLVMAGAVARAGEARDPALPASVPDYAGVTVASFMEKSAAIADVAGQEYVLPAIDPGKALVVAIEGKGSDDNPGTVDKPFATVARAARDIKAGGVILLRGGTHAIGAGVTLDGAKEQKGTRDAPIVIASFPGEVAVITAVAPVTGWTRLAESPIWSARPPRPAVDHDTLWIDGRIIPSARRALARTDEKRGDKSVKPLNETWPPVEQPGTFAVDGDGLYLRTPGDADPNSLRVEFSSVPVQRGSFYLSNTAWVVFDRLHFRRDAQAILALGSPYVIVRRCIFEDCLYGVTLFVGATGPGQEADVLRGVIDRCMFERLSDGGIGTPIYNPSPSVVRHCLFRDNHPSIAVTAYTSKNDGFGGVQIIGNTFVHGGAAITTTGRGSVVRDNVALCSRFLSSAGSDATIEGNLAVYDPTDLKLYPGTPRRDVGFRMYGRNARFANNALIGFAQGGNVYKPEGADPNAKAPVELRGNRVVGFTDYGLRIFDPGSLTSDGNVFAPAKEEARPIYLTPAPDDKHALTLEEWQQRGFDGKSKVESGSTVAIPRVLREAME